MYVQYMYKVGIADVAVILTFTWVCRFNFFYFCIYLFSRQWSETPAVIGQSYQPMKTNQGGGTSADKASLNQ